jgi:hypothetical protein
VDIKGAYCPRNTSIRNAYLNGLCLDGNKGCILKGLGSKEKTGIDVVFLQAGILHQDLLYAGAVCQEPENVLHGEPCAPDDWFAYHHFGIYGNPIEKVFIIHEDAIGGSFDINVRIDQKIERKISP